MHGSCFNQIFTFHKSWSKSKSCIEAVIFETGLSRVLIRFTTCQIEISNSYHKVFLTEGIYPYRIK